MNLDLDQVKQNFIDNEKIIMKYIIDNFNKITERLNKIEERLNNPKKLEQSETSKSKYEEICRKIIEQEGACSNICCEECPGSTNKGCHEDGWASTCNKSHKDQATLNKAKQWLKDNVECQTTISLKQYIATSGLRNMTPVEAEMRFKERAYADGTIEVESYYGGWEKLPTDKMLWDKSLGQYRLPLVNGDLVDLRMLECPGIISKPVPRQCVYGLWHVSVGVSGPFGNSDAVFAKECKNKQAAIAAWNSLMRKFGVKYEKYTSD